MFGDKLQFLNCFRRIVVMFFKTLQSMYAANDICVKIINNCERTRFFKSNVGVLQWDSISLLLFNLYLSDLRDYLGVDEDTPKLVSSNINCRMYAEDLILISRSETGLQELLNKLGEYCRKWRMEGNIEKQKLSNLVETGTDVSQFSGITIDQLKMYQNINT